MNNNFPIEFTVWIDDYTKILEFEVSEDELEGAELESVSTDKLIEYAERVAMLETMRIVKFKMEMYK